MCRRNEAPAEALELFERACDLECELGCYRAGRYVEACILGDGHGCTSAGFTSPLEATQTACETGDDRLCRLGGHAPR